MHTDKSFDYILDELASWIDMPKAFVIIPERAVLLEKVRDDLQAMLDSECQDSKVEISSCPLMTGDVVVSFDAFDFTVRDVTKFMNVVKHFNNFEIYPTEDGNIHFSGIFPKFADVTQI